MRKPLIRAAIIVLGLAVCACAPHFPLPGKEVAQPRFTRQPGVVASDGAVLGLEQWGPARPRAVIVAVHGMNDYSNAFADPAAVFAADGIATLAFDQRGFGRTPPAGLWPGTPVLVRDLDDVVTATCEKYPDVPVFVLGESMGAAVAALWVEKTGARNVRGVILSAPAVWGWQTLNPLYSAALSLSARIFPAKTFTGGRLKIWPSDNIEMLRALSRDPLVIKATRADAIYGLVSLMDEASRGAPKMSDIPIFVLYGHHDQIIPPDPVRKAFGARLRGGIANTRVAYYPHGYHMLLRDLSRATVDRDIVAWIDDRKAPLPSGAEVHTLDDLSRD